VIVSIIATTYIKVHQATTKVLNVLLWKIFNFKKKYEERKQQ
jgi:hypothetical protein